MRQPDIRNPDRWPIFRTLTLASAAGLEPATSGFVDQRSDPFELRGHKKTPPGAQTYRGFGVGGRSVAADLPLWKVYLGVIFPA